MPRATSAGTGASGSAPQPPSNARKAGFGFLICTTRATRRSASILVSEEPNSASCLLATARQIASSGAMGAAASR
jgi:hypothetical protein